MDKLNIFLDTTDYSQELNDFTDEVVVMSVDPTSYIYLGFHKPFNQLYLYMTTPNGVKEKFTVEYWDGSSWVSVLNLDDDTKSLTRSGFIKWQEADDNTTIEKNTINSIENYFYRISPDARVGIDVKGIGIIFSQDRDLYNTRARLDDSDSRLAVTGKDEDYMNVHLDVVDEIVQEIRREGIKKYQSENDPTRLKYYRNITKWDLFDVEEVKLAAKNLALANIYFNLSDSPEDKYFSEAVRFKDYFYKYIDDAMVSLDRNNDGRLQQSENIKPIKVGRMSR